MSQKSRQTETSTPMLPFLKWPGGKRWIAPVLSEILRGELSGHYFEPFLGAGAVFLRLRPTTANLSDNNAELIHFLHVVSEYPAEVVRRVWQWSNTRECYERVRMSRPRTHIGRTARFLYLNRTCWGGVYRTNRSGNFNVPFGNSGRALCSLQHVKRVSLAFSTAVIKHCDFGDAVSNAKHGDVVYADPPYTGMGEDNGFLRYNEKIFSWADQMRLAATLRSARQRGVFVALSGLHHAELFELYSGWWKITVPRYSGVSRVTSSRRRVSEVVIFSRKPKVWPSHLSGDLERI